MEDGDALPRPFGPYQLLVRLARGGMGEVFLAKHGGLQGFEKHCVVKTLRKDLADESEYVQRFTEEARVVVQLSHRNVCSVFDVGRAQGRLYLAMDYVVGRDLRLLVSRGPLATAVSVHIVSEILEALDYAHRFVDADTDQPLSLVHRDVSPHNVLLGVEGDVKLIDFGIATTVRVGPVTQDGTVLGKLTYMAPEHARGDPVDGRADQYSAAVLFVELLTGVAFSDGMSREESWAVAGVGGYRPKVFATLDPALRAILDRALHPSREKRFPTCSAFGEATVAWARERGFVADARDVRRLMDRSFPSAAQEMRTVLRDYAAVRAPLLDAVVKTPGFETIATTMMIAPTTAGISEAPATALIRERAAPAPIIVKRTAAWPLVVGLVLALGGIAGGVVLAQPHDESRVTALPEDAPVPTPIPPAPAPVPTPALAPIEPTPAPPRPTPSAPPRSAKLDADTRHTLAYLAGCVGVVDCAKGALDWSKKARLSESERQQLSESASDCARKCKMKR